MRGEDAGEEGHLGARCLSAPPAGGRTMSTSLGPRPLEGAAEPGDPKGCVGWSNVTASEVSPEVHSSWPRSGEAPKLVVTEEGAADP